jgi:redox-sensitive bicupin YhaK (pirin superfamily)
MSSSDFGHLLKPFVFLDLFDNHGKPFTGFGLHPHSGIATLTRVVEGNVRNEDTNGATGLLPTGGLDWMRARRRRLAWRRRWRTWTHAGGFQLRIALPPEQQLGPSERICQFPAMGRQGPLGSYGTATSAFKATSPINYLAVQSRARDSWRYQPPAEHRVLWAAAGMGSVPVADELRQGRAGRALNPENAAIEFKTQTAAEFVLGSAVPLGCDLVLSSHSVHTTAEALGRRPRRGSRQIAVEPVLAVQLDQRRLD